MADWWDLENCDLFAQLVGSNLRVVDCDGYFVADLPPQWTKEQAIVWARGYALGYNKGNKWGVECGKQTARNKMLEALGIKGDMAQVQNAIRVLAQTLYYHDGVCKPQPPDHAATS